MHHAPGSVEWISKRPDHTGESQSCFKSDNTAKHLVNIYRIVKLNTCSYYMSDRCFACVRRLGVKYSDFDKRWFVGPCVIKIKKSLQSFARVVLEEKMNKARNTDHVARTYAMFIYSIVKITRLYDYQTWQTHLLRNVRCAKVCGVFSWLFFSVADWLGRQTPITWTTW